MSYIYNCGNIYEQVIYQYYDTGGNYVWCGTVSGLHLIPVTNEVVILH